MSEFSEDIVKTMPNCTETTGNGSESTYRSVAELADDLNLSERSTRSALRRGEIPHIRIGRRFILPKAAIAEWLRTAGGRIGPRDSASPMDARPSSLPVLAE